MSDNMETQEDRPSPEGGSESRTEPRATATVVEEPVKRESRVEAEPEIRKSTLREYFESAVVTLIMAVFGMTFIVQAVKVPTGSMKNTIWIQDHLLVNKFIFGSQKGLPLPIIPARDIRRGDVVVFKYPGQPDVNYVKRVIALPGETVEYDSESHRVYINGQELPEHRIFVVPQGSEDPEPLEVARDDGAPVGAKWSTYYYQEDDETLSSRFYDSQAKYGVRQPFKIPVKGDPVPDEIEGDAELQRIYDADKDGRYDTDQYFCMGDNRDNSQDSRYWGTAPRASIVGRAMFVYWSVDRSNEGEGGNPVVDFFTRTRWSRTGTMIK